MMKTIICVLSVVILAACGSNNSKEKATEEKTVDVSTLPEYQEGMKLVVKHKCLTCHNVVEAVTGPPYREVAKKYAGMPDTIVSHLAKKIITGGNGVWGEIFMTPHPDVTQEEAETMVKYILLLKE